MSSETDGTPAERLAEALTDQGATAMFGMPGGGPNLDMIGAAEKRGMRFVLAHGETEAAIMASTYGLLRAEPCAVVVTRGPGAASLTNGLAQATLDRFPLIAVTDTVPQASAHRVAHQRIDQRSMLGPVAKVSATIGDDTGIEELRRLVAAAGIWPSGGVHLDFDPSATGPSPTTDSAPAIEIVGGAPEEAMISAALSLLSQASRPVAIVGMEAAVLASASGSSGRSFVDNLTALGCPILTTYQAIGTVPTEHEHSAGLFTNGALERPVLNGADLVITIGLDLVEPIPAPWTYEVPVIRLSSTEQADDYLPATVDVLGDVTAGLSALLVGLDQRPTAASTAPRASSLWSWEPGAAEQFRNDARAALAAGFESESGFESGSGSAERLERDPEQPVFGPLELVAGLIDAMPTEATVTVDAGAHFLAVMPNWPVDRPFELLISNGLATMGFAVPAAIGAALARPGTPVVALTGDGGLSMVLAELETMARLDLPITVVVFNDSALSLIEIKQQADHGGANAVRYRPVDFSAVGAAQGLATHVVTSAAQLAELAELPDAAGPRLIDARIDPSIYRHLITTTRG